MTAELPVFFRESDKKCFLVLHGQNLFCYVCEKIFSVGENVLVFHDFWMKRRGVLHHGSSCVDNLPHRHDINVSFVVAEVVENIPLGSRFALLSQLKLAASKDAATVFDAFSRRDGSVVVDRSVYAGRESFEGAVVGLPDMVWCEELDAPVRSSGEAFAFLDALKVAVPLLPEPGPGSGKKLLEGKGVVRVVNG